jgi:hypothetical protein
MALQSPSRVARAKTRKQQLPVEGQEIGGRRKTGRQLDERERERLERRAMDWIGSVSSTKCAE